VVADADTPAAVFRRRIDDDAMGGGHLPSVRGVPVARMRGRCRQRRWFPRGWTRWSGRRGRSRPAQALE
jgi:hypothetical protein